MKKRPNGKEIKLDYPIKVTKVENGITKEKDVDTLFLSRFKTKHLKLLPESFLKKAGKKGKDQELSLESLPELIPLFASMLDLTEVEAGEIDIEDLIKMAGDLGEVLGN